MEDPLALIALRSKFQKPIRLSFEIVLSDDDIYVSFSDIPKNNEPWYAYYESAEHGSGMLPLYCIHGGISATPESIAKEFCKTMKSGEPKEVRNVQLNYVDLKLPKFIKVGPVATRKKGSQQPRSAPG